MSLNSDTSSESNNSNEELEQEFEEEFMENEIVMNSSYVSSTDSETNSENENDIETYDTNNVVFVYQNLENTFQQMLEEDTEFLEKEKIDNNYYIGIATKPIYQPQFLLANSVSAAIFLKYDQRTIIEYLKYYTGFYLNNPRLHIMQLTIEPANQMYNVILKTFWIRIIQRTWKNIYKKRMYVISSRKQISSMIYSKLYGNYRMSEKYLPTIHGMLSKYNNKLLSH